MDKSVLLGEGRLGPEDRRFHGALFLARLEFRGKPPNFGRMDKRLIFCAACAGAVALAGACGGRPVEPARQQLMREAHVPNPDFPVLKGEDGSYDWGDTGDGRYRNPVLLADYSDPDAIRVGDRYYLVASDFHFLGMQVLKSDDLVNWRLISQIYDRFDLPGWDENAHYAGGSWAPSIRWHDGRFYVYFCTPDEGLFMSSAADPAGPWDPLHCVKAVYHWEDPCPFWDEDGQAYLGHSLHGAGPIIIHKMP